MQKKAFLLFFINNLFHSFFINSKKTKDHMQHVFINIRRNSLTAVLGGQKKTYNINEKGLHNKDGNGMKINYKSLWQDTNNNFQSLLQHF